MRPKNTPSDGRTVRHQGYGLCERCHTAIRRLGKLESYNKPPYAEVRRCLKGQTCDFCEGVRWLADNGVSVYDWARRLDTNPIALQRRLYRHNKHRLANMLRPALCEKVSA